MYYTVLLCVQYWSLDAKTFEFWIVCPTNAPVACCLNNMKHKVLEQEVSLFTRSLLRHTQTAYYPSAKSYKNQVQGKEKKQLLMS